MWTNISYSLASTTPTKLIYWSKTYSAWSTECSHLHSLSWFYWASLYLWFYWTINFFRKLLLLNGVRLTSSVRYRYLFRELLFSGTPIFSLINTPQRKVSTATFITILIWSIYRSFSLTPSSFLRFVLNKHIFRPNYFRYKRCTHYIMFRDNKVCMSRLF